MLIDFTVENYRSYREAKTFSLVASGSRELANNLVEVPPLGESLTRTAAIYGANASGKSNLLEAMNALSELLTNPAGRSFMEEVDLPPFALDPASGSKPTRFNVRFVLGGVLYDYGIAARPGLVEEERLVAYPAGRQQEWFTRSGMEITTKNHLKGQKARLKELTVPKVSFLAIAATFGHPQLTPLAQWIAVNLRRRFSSNSFARPFQRSVFEAVSRLCVTSKDFHEWVNGFLRYADLGIRRVEIENREEKVRRQVPHRTSDGKVETVEVETVSQRYEPLFVHTGAEGFTTKFPIAYESQGTRRLFSLLTAFYGVLQGDAAEVVAIDEFGESMHPSLAREIVRLFQDPKTNPRGSQLVFTTHDTALLTGRLFRRDQIWFAEKDSSGATDLYSLHDVKDVREDEAFEKGYLRGRYGAIPFFGSADFIPGPEIEPSESRSSEADPRPTGAVSGTEKNGSDCD